MSKYISRLVSSSVSLGDRQRSPARAYTINISSTDPLKLTTIRPGGAPQDTPPLYSFTGSMSTKPNAVLYQGSPSPHTAIGEGHFSSMASTNELFLRGMPMMLRQSQLSENFAVDCNMTGLMKWKKSELSGSSLSLYDNSGFKVAKLTSGLRAKTLEIYVDCSDAFVEVVLFTAVTAKVLHQINEETAVDVVSSVLGG